MTNEWPVFAREGSPPPRCSDQTSWADIVILEVNPWFTALSPTLYLVQCSCLKHTSLATSHFPSSCHSTAFFFFFCSQFSHSVCLLWNAIFFSYPSMSFGCSSYFPLRVLFSSFPFYRILTNKTLKQLVQEKGNIYIYSPFTKRLHSLSRKKEKQKYNRMFCMGENTATQFIQWTKTFFSTVQKKTWKKFHMM